MSERRHYRPHCPGCGAAIDKLNSDYAEEDLTPPKCRACVSGDGADFTLYQWLAHHGGSVFLRCGAGPQETVVASANIGLTNVGFGYGNTPEGALDDLLVDLRRRAKATGSAP